MSTIQEVAARAGRSFGPDSDGITRSRLVRGRAGPSRDAARKNVRFMPGAADRSLRRQVTRSVGVLMVDNAHPFFAELTHQIEYHCHRNQYAVLLCNSYNDAARQDAALQTLLEKRVDGLIVAAVGNFEVVARQLRSVRVPIVLIDRHVPNVEADTVQVNHERAGYLATRHLLVLGHRRIGCIAGPSATSVFPLRLDGYRRALAGAGLAPRPGWVAEVAALTMEHGYEAAERLMRLDAGLTAIFASSDILAMGALRCAAERGIAVPGAVSIIGLDGVELGQYLSPALTSMAQPTQGLGELVVTCLLERIRYGQRSAPIRNLKLPPELIVRASTGPPSS